MIRRVEEREARGGESFNLGYHGRETGWKGEDGERERMGVQMKTMDGWTGGEEKERGVGCGVSLTFE